MPKATLQLGSRKRPAAELPTCCCCPSWGATSSSPAGAGLPDPARRAEGWGGGVGGSGGRFSSQAASRDAGVASSPPRRGSRGRPCGQARCDWLAGAGGRSQAGRYLKRAQDIAERTGALASAQPSPAPASWVLGILVCFGSLAFTNYWILHASVPPTSTSCPHAPAPATGKGCCVFSSLLVSRCLGVLGSGLGPPAVPNPTLHRCSRGAQLSRCCSASRRCGVPDHVYRVCVRTRTSPELKILRHAWNS